MDDMRPPLFISFSGGRTSAYMTHLLKTRVSILYRPIVLFANTGLEDPRTLTFVRNCDEHFGFGTVWLEAEVDPRPGEGTKHRVVSFETASRNGEPFEEMIKKYGIPNKAFPQCTRELKLRPMHSYLRSIGVAPSQVMTAIGIRSDETRRVSKNLGNIVYPLAHWVPTDKQDVLDWWEEQPFDLGIEEFEGNCRGCFKKSDRKIFATLDSDPAALDWHVEMERKYRHVGPQMGERVFFRSNRSATNLKEEHRLLCGFKRPPTSFDAYESGGCSESCELYPTEAA